MKNQLILFLLFWTLPLFAQRQEIPFNKDWQFAGSTPSGQTYQKSISLPHTWNDKDVQQGILQHRTTGVYTKTFFGNTDWSKKRVFIHFEGANITTTVQ